MIDDVHDLGNKKQVFIDWGLIEPGNAILGDGEPESWEMPDGLRLAPHKPRIEPLRLLWADKPWETYGLSKHIILEDEGRYRMYYLCSDRRKGNDPSASMLCYAESADGLSWTKPNLGIVDFGGSKENNLVFVREDAPLRSPTVFDDPSAQPGQRYKMVFRGTENGEPTVYGAVSPDGLHWEQLPNPLGSFFTDTMIVVGFDADRGRYFGYYRGWEHGRRTIAYAETDRFESWPVPETIVAADMHDSPDADIYTNAYTRWPGADAHLIFPSFFQRKLDIFELHMMTSRDGLHWQRPMRGPIIPSGEPGTDAEGLITASSGVLCVRPGEWSVPITQTNVSHNQQRSHEEMTKVQRTGYLTLATWRQDGFVSLEAETEGRFTTRPMTFAGGRLEVNAWTQYGGEIRVELADTSGEVFTRKAAEPIVDRTFEDCDPITGDHLKHTITWKGESDLSAWAGKPVRLRFRMRRARLYAIQLV